MGERIIMKLNAIFFTVIAITGFTTDVFGCQQCSYPASSDPDVCCQRIGVHASCIRDNCGLTLSTARDACIAGTITHDCVDYYVCNADGANFESNDGGSACTSHCNQFNKTTNSSTGPGTLRTACTGATCTLVSGGLEL